MICGNCCSASSYYQFAYLGSSQMNQVEYLSVSNCSYTTSGYSSIDLDYGNQKCDNTNCSMNYANQISGLQINSPSQFTSSHCTFSNNEVSNYICLYFFSDSGTLTMSYANIIHNKSPNTGVVFANGAGSRKMIYCIFHNNQNNLFCLNAGSLEVSHSFIEHSLIFSVNTVVSTSTNNSFTITNTYQLQYFNSLHCNADKPYIEATPIQTNNDFPIRSIDETSKMTNQRTVDQTIRESPKETIPRTYDEITCTNQMFNKIEICMTFSFFFFYLSYIY